MTRASTILAGIVAAGLAAAQTPPQQTPPPAPPEGKLTILFNFDIFSRTNGFMPRGGLVLGPDGHFYGTATAGGQNNAGTIFEISPDGNLNTLYHFKGGADGGQPRGTLVSDGRGNFYGTTASSTVFRITTSGVYTLLGRVPAQDPNPLLYASDGNVYGTTASGGSGNAGVFFRVTTGGDLTVIRAFGRGEGINRASALVEGPDGNFYGTTPGSVFKLTPAGDVTLLKTIPPNTRAIDAFDGLGSLEGSGLVLGADGNFYGVASGPPGVFRVSPSGDFKRLFRYSDVMLTGDGASPYRDNRTALIVGADGNLYGTDDGGSYDTCYGFCGSVYQVTTDGQVKIIYRIPGTGEQGGIPSTLALGPDGLYGTTWNYGKGKPQGGGTVFKVTFDGSGGGGGSIPPAGPSTSSCQPATSSEITAVDPNTSDNLRAPMLKPELWDKSAYQAFADSTATVTGIAADGVTPVILRWRMPKDGKVTFTLSDEGNAADPTGALGMLGCLTSSNCEKPSPTNYAADVQRLSDGSCMAFVRLTSPPDFVRAGNDEDAANARRPVQIIATLAASDGASTFQNTVLFITRTPVVLLHGLWSDKFTWEWGLQADKRFLWCAPNYVNNNAANFGVNAGKPLEGIQCGLNMLRSYGIAGTQVDFVGHSMGGLLGRIYAGDFFRTTSLAYRRDDNLQLGDIHKLITLDTPHFGSKLANELVDSKGNITKLGIAVQGVFDGFETPRCIACGAVFDLSVGSPAVTNMPAVPTTPAHAIVAVGGAPALNTGLALLGPSGVLAKALLIVGAGWEFFGNENHDLIVAESSQAGGLTGAAVSRFELTPFGLGLHFTVTGEDRISDRVIELLNTPAASPSFGRFQATHP